MSRYFEDPASLSTKYAVGEIVDIVGVPALYEDGKSTWMRTGTWIDTALVPESVISNIKEAEYSLTALTDNSLIDEFNAYIPGLLPPAIVGTTRCFPYSANIKARNAWAFVVNATGPSLRAIGQTCGYYQASTGGGNAIVSNGTKFWSYTVTADGTAFTAKSSTDGITWATETLSGQATFSAMANKVINMSDNNPAKKHGELFASNLSMMMVVWCGARFLLIGSGASFLLAQRSTNGSTFGGDETTAILGTTSHPQVNQWWSYRNGNNFFISFANIARKSSDGGVTWAAATNALSMTGSTGYRVNSSDPARIMASESGATAISVSIDSGQTWTARVLPIALVNGDCVYGRASKWIFHSTSGATYVSNDDGATWAIAVTLPSLDGPISGVYADATRWYALSMASNQIAISTDFVTWTVRNIFNPGPSTAPSSIAATDSDHIVLCSAGTFLYTIDGGVTWQWASGTSATTNKGTAVFQIVPCTTGTPMFISGQTGNAADHHGLYIAEADLDNGGKAVRSSTVAVTPLRTNALAYARIA